MNIFGFTFPVWIVLTIAFGVLYLLFTVLGKIKESKIKVKREKINVTDNI